MLAVSDKLCLKCSTVYYKQLPKFKFKNWSHLADVQNVQIIYTLKQNKTLITNKNIYILHGVAELAADK